MKAGIIAGAGVLIAVAAVVLVLVQDDEISASTVGSDRLSGEEKHAHDTVKVAYAKTPEKAVVSGRPETVAAKRAAPEVREKKDPRIKYQTTDSSGRYGFQLIDEAKTEGLGNETVGFVGKINGNRFVIRIPKALRNSDLVLKVVDRKTKETKTVTLPFVADLGKPGYAPVMEMDFESAENYTAESNPQVAAVYP